MARKQVPLLYDTFVEQDLEWPSLTVQWLPAIKLDDGTAAADLSTGTGRLLLGTQTSNEEPNHLLVHELYSPHRQCKTFHFPHPSGSDALDRCANELCALAREQCPACIPVFLFILCDRCTRVQGAMDASTATPGRHKV